ncbi:hypothetical protein ACFLUX_02095 [Chloroflexota bacterium]
MNEVLLYIGSAIIIIWGIAHLIPTKAIVNGFGEITEDNKKIIMMESIAEGITLCFLGILVVLVTTLGDSQGQTASVIYYSVVAMLLVMALLTALTGARTSILPYKICPFVKTLVAILIISGVAI